MITTTFSKRRKCYMKTITQVAEMLNVRPWHIRHALNYIDKPPIFAGRYVFSDSGIATLATYFSRKEKDTKPLPMTTKS
jgi:hypothetical protein